MHTMHKDISFAGNTKHTGSFLWTRDRVEAMLPEAARMRIMHMLMHHITGDRQRLLRGCSKGEDTTRHMFIDQKIAGGQRQRMFRNVAGIFKTVLCMQMANNCAAMMLEVSGSDQDRFANFEANLQMSGVLELITHIASQVRHMPSHPKRR